MARLRYASSLKDKELRELVTFIVNIYNETQEVGTASDFYEIVSTKLVEMELVTAE